MPVTIKVNGTSNSLVHKGSNGISTATIPDVCKTPTPGGPVPIPYPNISQSTTLAKGTTTVKADGGMMIAIKGSEFSMSNGDEPGSIGGVKSSTFIKESTWITYSFDVKMDGKNACRLTDKKFQNHENTVDLAGTAQLAVAISTLEKMVCDCHNNTKPKRDSTCTSLGTEKHNCVNEAIKNHKPPPKLGPERGYKKNGKPFPKGTTRESLKAQGKGKQLKGSWWPDACMCDNDGNPTQFFEFKFKCPPKTKIKKNKKKTRWIRSGSSKQHPTWTQYNKDYSQEDKYKNFQNKIDPKVKSDPVLINTAKC